MHAKNLQNFPQFLADTGFICIEGDHYAWDMERGKGALRAELPWHIHTWEIDLKNGEFQETAFAIHLNSEHFLLNLQDGLRAQYPSFRKVSLESDKTAGSWLLVEFLDPHLDSDQSLMIEDEEASPVELPHGLAALHLSVVQAFGQVSIFMTKQSLIGNTPGPFFIELPRLLNHALFGVALQGKTNFNSYLLTLKTNELRSTLIDFCGLSDSARQLALREDDSTFGQIKLAFEGQTYKLSWESGEEIPGLHVPPMEILEQKEVARRFQRLDELILLEDYQGALEQCQEYLTKNTQSLYLVRRWAFLTLWANRPFERKYLDLMSKLDPQNLMTLSLTVRDAQASGHSDRLLESLSNLGSSLGQSVEHFDSLDITSLTLPEMLGDAWRHRDEQRAVSCYERVLDARGEIPRILGKLIRLMRDVQDSTAEELYMDRLLACDVPTRTRAAIYHRFAEIKRKLDPADACHWALKSWHTHRLHVRYAVLTAELLIELGKPLDGVHVLVQTSEALEGQPNEARLGLELKIATIWLDHINRFDLASERVSRALDLVGGDADAYDEIIRLVQKFEDAPLLLDVTMRALVLAEKSRDTERLLHYANALLLKIDSASDQEQSRAIYQRVLHFILIGVDELHSLLKRSDLDLPFQEIADSVEQRITGISLHEQASYQLMFGEVSEEKFGDSVGTYTYYEKALRSGFLNQRSFDFLDSYYSRRGLNSERFHLLKRRLEEVQGSDRAGILRELFYFDEDVSNLDKDHYALQILRGDADDVGPIEERLKYYAEKSDGAAILAMMATFQGFDLDTIVTKTVIQSGIHAIQSIGSIDCQVHLKELRAMLGESEYDPKAPASLNLDGFEKVEEVKDVAPESEVLKPSHSFAMELDEIDAISEVKFELQQDKNPVETVISEYPSHDILFSRPAEAKFERGFEHSHTYPPSDPSPMEDFSLSGIDGTDNSRFALVSTELHRPPPLPLAVGLPLSRKDQRTEFARIDDRAGPRPDLPTAWKLVAQTAKPDQGLLQELLIRPLPELCEQIMAVQVSALSEDKIATLDSFPHRIWRDPFSVSYELKWTLRMTREQFHPGIKTPLARLLKALYPIFIQTFALEMGLAGVADRLKLRGDEILKIRKGIDFNDEVFERSNLRHYAESFQDGGYSLYHIPSIGDRFQFDFEKRDIYIDRNHYMATPSSHLFHRLTFLLRAVSLDYFPFLNLSPSGEIYPFLMKCKRSLDQTDLVKRGAGVDKDPLRQILSQAKDREHLSSLFAEVGTLSADRISLSVSHFIEQIYRLNLAETLDLIGLIETICGIDLSNPRISSLQRMEQSSSARSILAFARELKFT